MKKLLTAALTAALIFGGFLCHNGVVLGRPLPPPREGNDWSTNPSSIPSPEPDLVPQYMRQHPCLVADMASTPDNPADPDNPALIRAAWVWAYDFAGPATNLQVGPGGSLWGDTWGYVLRGDEGQPEQPRRVGGARLPMAVAGFSDMEKLSEFLRGTLGWVPVVYGQTERMYKKTDPAIDVEDAPLPDGPGGVLLALPPALYDRMLSLGYEEYRVGEHRFLKLGTGKDARVAEGFHRMSYTAVMRDGSHADVTKLDPGRYGDIKGEFPKDNWKYAATAPPGWDAAAPRPDFPGFYRAPQTWHPALAGDWPGTVPGTVSFVLMWPMDWDIQGPAEVRGRPGAEVEVPLQVTNRAGRAGEARLSWLWEGDPSSRAPVPGGESLHLGPGESATVALKVRMPDRQRNAWFGVNTPPRGFSELERDYTNNIWVTRLVPETVDLAVGITAVERAWTGLMFYATARYVNKTDTPVDTVGTFKVWGGTDSFSDRHAFHLGPYGRKEYLYEVMCTEPGKIWLRCEVNPGRDKPPGELRWDNNSVTAEIPVEYIPTRVGDHQSRIKVNLVK